MRILRWTALLVLVAAIALGMLLSVRPRPEALDRHRPGPGLARSDFARGELRVQFLGNTNLLFSDGETRILTDGFFSRPPIWKMLGGEVAPDGTRIGETLARAGIDSLDLVVPVHDHYDHAMDTPVVAQLTGARIRGSSSTLAIARGLAFDEARFDLHEYGKPVRIGAFTLTAIKSRHWQYPVQSMRDAMLDQRIEAPLVPPVHYSEYKEGDSVSLILEHGDVRIGIQGSAGFVPFALEGYAVDILFLGIGGIAGSPEADQLAWHRHVSEALAPQVLVPIHWDDFFAPLADDLPAPSLLQNWVLGDDLGKAFELVERLNLPAGRRIVVLPPLRQFGIADLLVSGAR